MSKVRVNIRCANVGKIRKEKRDGRDKIIVPSATLPDDVVMNGIIYPAAEIEASFATLEGTPAPLGHPTLGGKFVAANHTEAFIRNGIGAYNENVRREDGRVLLDKVIDVEFAKLTEGGKAVLNAIEKGEPIHTSTGLLCTLENTDGKKVARNILFDHDAILIGEAGAATPEQGVGMLVNKAVDHGEEIEVINSYIEDADRELDWAGMRLIEAFDRRDKATVWERMKAALLGALAAEREPSLNNQENDMPITDEQFQSLSAEVKTLSDGMKDIGTTITNAVTAAMKPLVEAQDALINAQKATEEAEKAELVTKVVNANLLDKDAAEELSLASLRKQAAKIVNKGAAPLHGAFNAASDKPTFKLPEGT
ncbi:hypothetical protein [Falsirhodobacter sp. 1013]|uniref:hypothetical protein n=1 Tax=Falsirhodobacter sp. 1013 TaxID=3417566 RepID=UPI003EBC882F